MMDRSSAIVISSDSESESEVVVINDLSLLQLRLKGAKITCIATCTLVA